MTQNFRTSFILLTLLLTLPGCGQRSGAGSAPTPNIKKVTLSDVGLDEAAMDLTADPCTDFYQYACGGWLKSTEIPADKSRWSRSFSEITERNRAALRTILEKGAPANPNDAGLAKLANFYGACMDEAGLEKAGLTGLKPLQKKIAGVRDARSLTAVITELHASKVWVAFDISASQDFKDATKVIAYLDQNGLGLPDRDYYLENNDRMKTIRSAYLAHVEKMMTLAGSSKTQARQVAKDVMALETELAKVSMSKVDRRDPYKIYHKTSLAELKKLSPTFAWDAYLAAHGLASLKDLNVTVPDFFKGFDKLVRSAPMSRWRNYLAWQLLADAAAADAVPKALADESFAMRQTLTGQPEQEVRWKRCVAATDGALGELLGQYYVEKHFAGESKQVAEGMVHGITDAFEQNLTTLDWMDDTTKRRAKEKSDIMVYKIGYPKKWRDYTFPVDSHNHLANLVAAATADLERDLAKIGKPVDRDEWGMTPPTVNAYYNPLLNEMVFPAGILQPPFYAVSAAVQVNLGAIGMVVGHELTHGFDDEGSKFAGDGNLKEWWDPQVTEKFKAKTACVSQQYAAYEVLPGLKINGDLTLGENIADIGGIKMAFAAHRTLQAARNERVQAGPLTEDQQFFVGVGQAWCSKDRDELARMLIKVDPHSPPRFRVNGALSNSPAFAEAFACATGTPMRPTQVCSVW